MSRDTLKDPRTETIDNTTECTIPIKENGEWVDSPIGCDVTVNPTKLISTLPIQIPPSGALLIGTGQDISGALHTIHLANLAVGDNAFIDATRYDDAGIVQRENVELNARSEVLIQPLNDEIGVDPVVLINSPDDILFYGGVYEFSEPATNGSAIIRYENGSGDIISETKNVTAPADIEVAVLLPNPILLRAGETVCVEFFGVSLKGHNYIAHSAYGTQFFPWLKSDRQDVTFINDNTYTDEDKTKVTNIPDHADYLDKTTYDPTNVNDDAFDMGNMIESAANKILSDTERTDISGNKTHASSDGKNHSDVVLNNSHRSGDGSDHSGVSSNTTHRSSDGKNHSDVVLNNSHRVVSSGNPHAVTKTEIGLSNVDNVQQIPLSQKAAASGVASLNLSGKVPAEQLPTSASNYLGMYDIITNTPVISDGAGANGDYYLCGTAGTRDFGSGNVTVALGDQLIYNGSIWEAIPSSNTVLSVNDKIGVVELDTDDVDEGVTNQYYTESRVSANSDVTANTAHKGSDGKDHSDVILNNSHRASDGKNHSDVILNNSHRSGTGSDHSDVAANTVHKTSDGKNHSDVVLNNTHRASDGKNHSDVVLNNTHRSSDGKDHSDVVTNNAKVSFPEAPEDGKQYARKDAAWDEVLSSSADMSKSVYDVTDNGIVDNSEKLGAQTSSYHLSRSNHTDQQPASTISDFDTEVSNNTDVDANTTHRGETTGNPHSVTKTEIGLSNVNNEAQIPLTQKGVANGVPTLDAAVRVPESQLPLVAVKFKGDYDIATNTPTLSDATGINGIEYRCSLPGIRDFGNGPLSVAAGERLIHNGSIWQNGGLKDAITGLDTDDVSEASNLYYTESRVEAHEFDSVKFDTDLAVESYLNGRMGWDKVNQCPYFMNDRPSVMHQIGRELWARSCNNTGSQILNGRVVYISGIDSGCPEIDLAQADEYNASRTIGVATENIDDGGFGVGEGEVTSYGLVNGINTSSLSTGPAYLDHDGVMVSTKPTGTHHHVFVGTVLVSDPTNGILFVNPSISNNTVEVIDTNGFPSEWRVGSAMSFVNGTRTFSIAPTGDHFHYYINGDVYKVDASNDYIIPNTEGIHYIYYDTSTLSCVANPTKAQQKSIIITKCLVAILYWDVTNQEVSYFGDERHGISMAPDTHAYNHLDGSKYVDGLGLDDFVIDDDGSLDTHAQFSIEAGTTVDQDLKTDHSAIASTVGLPIYYLDGASANLRKITQSGYSVVTDVTAGVGATGRIVWNEYTGATWQLTTLGDGKFVNCLVFAINGIDGEDQQIVIVGQIEYDSKIEARMGVFAEISAIKVLYPFLEIVELGGVIFQSDDTYSNSVKSIIVSPDNGGNYVDVRSIDPAYLLDLSNSTGQIASSQISDLSTDGWLTGLLVQENAPKDQQVAYGLGTYMINGVEYAIASNGVYDLENAYGSVDHYSGMVDDQHAFVSICVDADEVIKSVMGNIGEKGEPIFPAPHPLDSVCVALIEIKVDKNDNPKDIGNKQIDDERSTTSFNTDESVAISTDDLTSGHLFDKISTNGSVVATIENPGGDEKLILNSSGGTSVFGELTRSSAGNQSLGTTLSRVEWNQAGGSNLTTVSTSNNRITVLESAAFNVEVKGSAILKRNEPYSLYIRVNSDDNTDFEITCAEVPDDNYCWPLSCGKILTLAANDYVEIWGSCAANKDFKLQLGASFSVIKI